MIMDSMTEICIKQFWKFCTLAVLLTAWNFASLAYCHWPCWMFL